MANTYIIVKAAEDIYPDDLTRYQKGYIVEILGHDMLQGDTSGKYCQFHVTDFDYDSAFKGSYIKEWRPEIDWDFVGHDYTLDGHRLRVWMENMSASGLNSLTRDKIENFLNRWNAEIFSTDVNEVVFDVLVQQVIQSEGFWGRDVLMVGFIEKSYDQPTGVHSIEVNYENAPYTEDQILMSIQERGGEVTKTVLNKITFSISRTQVFDWFKADVKEALNMQMFSRRQFRVPDNVIQMALDAGGTLQITKNQFVTYVRNRLDD